jgi:hypothetical protein
MTQHTDSPQEHVESLVDLLRQLRHDLQPALARDAHDLLLLASQLEGVGLRNLADHDPRWLNVRALAHQLAGSVGTLGWERAGTAAVDLQALTSGKPRPTPEDWSRLWRQALELVSLLDQQPQGEG